MREIRKGNEPRIDHAQRPAHRVVLLVREQLRAHAAQVAHLAILFSRIGRGLDIKLRKVIDFDSTAPTNETGKTTHEPLVATPCGAKFRGLSSRGQPARLGILSRWPST
jgi:hypothetical protein